MANFFENKDRKVIPNFRSFHKATESGELLSSGKRIDFSATINAEYFKKLKSDWRNDNSIGIASDLLGNALVCDFQDEIIQEAAKFILSQTRLVTKAQICLANRLLGQADCTEVSNGLQLNKLEAFLENNNLPNLYKKINSLKSYIQSFGNNPIAYVELSRLYSIIGQEKQAIKNMEIALHLTNSSRYVLRSASRLFAHFEDIDFAHELLRRNHAVKSDPWILSAEIAMATLRGRNSRFVKNGLSIIDSKSVSPFHFSELSSAIATIELINGSRKKSRKLFETSLIDPTDNSFAQFEWANYKENLFNTIEHKNNDRFFEANAISAYHNDDWKNTLTNSENWFIEMPFSKRPILLGSHVATIFLDDQNLAIKFCKAGLISHPNDAQLLNNIAYSQALNNQTKEANRNIEIAMRQPNLDKSTKICLIATKGLSLFREEQFDAARMLYMKAIENAKKENLNYFNWLAILNYAREELLIRSEYVDSAMQAVIKIPQKQSSEIDFLRERMIQDYKEFKN